MISPKLLYHQSIIYFINLPFWHRWKHLYPKICRKLPLSLSCYLIIIFFTPPFTFSPPFIYILLLVMCYILVLITFSHSLLIFLSLPFLFMFAFVSLSLPLKMMPKVENTFDQPCFYILLITTLCSFNSLYNFIILTN